MYATSMAQRNVVKATVPDRGVWLPKLPVLSLLCAWARHLKTRTQRGQATPTSVRPASKTPVNQKICHLNTLHPYQRKLENEQRESYQILLASCWNTDIRLFDFYRLGPDQSHYNQSRLWSRLHTTLTQITRIKPKWIYTEYIVLNIFSPFDIFEQLELALKNRVCPKIFHCIEYIFYH